MSVGMAQKQMNEMLQLILTTSTSEWIAFFSSILYVVIIALQKKTAWFFAFISSALYVYLCFSSKLYLDSFLQFFYVLAAIYGWMQWNKTDLNEKLSKKNIRFHLSAIGICIVISLSIGWIMKTFTDQASPYLDATITITSLFATYLVARKIIDNWVYWIFIDLACIPIFYSRGLYLTSILYLIYAIIAIVAFFKWNKEYRKQHEL
ncbi:MAG: nicotinamide riboside transporter PnuC [Crocinitomicaceae bacterium]|nr:nicotinamide riboside transporter PnuC [Crocinitomicaceae bacterium]